MLVEAKAVQSISNASSSYKCMQPYILEREVRAWHHNMRTTTIRG